MLDSRSFLLNLAAQPGDPCLSRSLPPESHVRPILTGGGKDVLHCGHCHFALGDHVDVGAHLGQELKCPRCGCANEVK